MEDDSHLEEFFGVYPCRYLSHEFVRKHIRLNLKSEEFFGEFLNSVASCDDLETKIMLPSFWRKRLDDLDSKFMIDGRKIKSTATWLTIAKRFYDTFINVAERKLEPQIESKFKKALDFNFAEKNCHSAAELFTYLEQAYQSAHTELPLFDQNGNEVVVDGTSGAQNPSVTNEIAVTPDNNNSNVSPDVLDSSWINLDPSSATENHDINKISNSQEESGHLSEISNESQNVNAIPDSMNLRGRYWLKKKRPLAVTFSDDNNSPKDPHAQARNELNELNLILRQHASPDKRSCFRGKKIQLRAKNLDKELERQIEDALNDNDNADDASTASDGPDLVNSSLNVRTDYQRVFNNKAKHAYTMDEDHNILKFIIKTGRYAEIKGKQLWIDMKEHNVNAGRSWQSMKERFRKSIFPNLSLYVDMCRLDEESVQLLQDNFNYESSATIKARLAKKDATRADTASNDASKVLGNNYSPEEDEEIIKFIFKQDIGDAYLGGRNIWIKAEKHFARVFNGRNRTWQSLKERFIKRICPRLYKYKHVTSYSKALAMVEKCCPSLDDQNKIKQHLKHRFSKN